MAVAVAEAVGVTGAVEVGDALADGVGVLVAVAVAVGVGLGLGNNPNTANWVCVPI
ncbi:MAG: hypothetical protein WCB16_19895 [Candidatus Binatus sp.]